MKTKLKIIALHLFFFVILTNCAVNSNHFDKDKIWFGGYRLVDSIDVHSALPAKNYVVMENDSTIHVILNGNIIDTIINNLLIKRFEVKENVLILDGIYYFINVNNLHSANDNVEIKNKCWESDKYLVCFTDSTFIFRNLIMGQTVYKCFQLENFNSYEFINLYGNKWECNSYFNFFRYQISKIDFNTIVLKGYIEGYFKEIRLKRTTTLIGHDSSFQVCDNLFYPIHPKYRYDVTGVQFKGGIYNIKKIFGKKYFAPIGVKESGLIRIRFIVNCKGETGQFEKLEMDNNYAVKSFNPNISSQILRICEELDQWVPGNRDEQKVDSYKFLTFKIKDSEIIEIYP